MVPCAQLLTQMLIFQFASEITQKLGWGAGKRKGHLRNTGESQTNFNETQARVKHIWMKLEQE